MSSADVQHTRSLIGCLTSLGMCLVFLIGYFSFLFMMIGYSLMGYFLASLRAKNMLKIMLHLKSVRLMTRRTQNTYIFFSLARCLKRHGMGPQKTCLLRHVRIMSSCGCFAQLVHVRLILKCR